MKAISTSGLPCLFAVRFAVFCHKGGVWVSDLSGCLQAGRAASQSHTTSAATLPQLDKPIQAAFFVPKRDKNSTDARY